VSLLNFLHYCSMRSEQRQGAVVHNLNIAISVRWGSLFFLSFSVQRLPYFINMYHVTYFDLYMLQDHFPKQAHLMSDWSCRSSEISVERSRAAARSSRHCGAGRRYIMYSEYFLWMDFLSVSTGSSWPWKQRFERTLWIQDVVIDQATLLAINSLLKKSICYC
jgi:hypothetical protein